MLIIIDGYNLMFAGLFSSEGGAKRAPNTSTIFLERARDKLISQLKSYNIRRKHQIIIVFDGAGSNNTGYYYSQKESSGIKIIFSSGAGKSTADDVIIDIVSSHSRTNRQSLRVVTSDRELTEIILKYGVRVTPVSEFINELSLSDKRRNNNLLEEEPIEKFIGLSPAEVEKWRRVFEKND